MTTKNFKGLNAILTGFAMILMMIACNPDDPTPNNQDVIITTAEITEITTNSAVCGGEVTYSGDEIVYTKGVCYGTASLPTVYGSTTYDSAGVGAFTSHLTGLIPATTYFVRAYVFVGDSAYYGNERTFTTEESSVTYGSVSDGEGNDYRTLNLGNQTWMADNLRAEKYNDGTEITLVEDSNSWYQLTTPAYCYLFNNEAAYKQTYGALYNYYAVESGKLCPQGWHVPTLSEWQQLLDYLSAQGFNYDGTTVSNKVAVAMCTWEDWGYSTGMGCPGNDDYQFLHNASGFSAWPAGYRIPLSPLVFGSFIFAGTQTSWWAGDKFNSELGNTAVIDNSSPMVNLTGQMMSAGKSVRCIQD